MAGGTRKADWQLATRAHISEDHFGNGVTVLLSQIPALKNHWHILHEIIDRKRASIVEKHDYRFACGQHGFDQFLLPADQIEADRKSTRLNSSHLGISYAVFCLKKKTGNV